MVTVSPTHRPIDLSAGDGTARCRCRCCFRDNNFSAAGSLGRYTTTIDRSHLTKRCMVRQTGEDPWLGRAISIRYWLIYAKHSKMGKCFKFLVEIFFPSSMPIFQRNVVITLTRLLSYQCVHVCLCVSSADSTKTV